jgi:hypothetical protein
MKFIDFLFETFIELPLWARYLFALIIGCTFYGVEQAWGERRFIAHFSEAFFAAALHIGSIAISIIVSIPTWKYIYKNRQNKIAAWLVSVLLFFTVATILGLLITEIPGVGWRYKQMIN